MAAKCSIEQTKRYVARIGGTDMSLPALKKKLAGLGYRMKFGFNYTNDYNRPDCWRASHYEVFDNTTGKHFSHYQGRRDASHEALQALRKSTTILHRGRLVEF